MNLLIYFCLILTLNMFLWFICKFHAEGMKGMSHTVIANWPGLWSACGLCRAECPVPPGDCPGRAGEGRGMLGEPGQLDVAGEAMLWDEGNGLPSVCPRPGRNHTTELQNFLTEWTSARLLGHLMISIKFINVKWLQPFIALLSQIHVSNIFIW